MNPYENGQRLSLDYHPDQEDKLERVQVDPRNFTLEAFIEILQYQSTCAEPRGVTTVNDYSVSYTSSGTFLDLRTRSVVEQKEKIAELAEEMFLSERVIFERT